MDRIVILDGKGLEETTLESERERGRNVRHTKDQIYYQ